MAHLYKSYTQYYDLIDKCNHNKNIQELFDEATKNDPVNGINEMFIAMIATSASLETIKEMISLGADPRYDNDNPFIVACRNYDMALFFIQEYGPDINSTDGRAFFVAIKSLDTIKLLIENGLIITDRIMEICFTDIVFIKLLIESGYDIQKIVVVSAKYKMSKDVCEFIVDIIEKTPELFISSEILSDILINNCYRLSFENIKFMVELGANPIHHDVLEYACQCEDSQILLYLINECGCDVNAEDSEYLSSAIQNNYLINIKILLDAGIKISDDDIYYALGHDESTNLLIQYGVDPERIGKILIDCIIEKYSIPFVKLLMDNKVDLGQLFSCHVNKK